MEIDVFTLFPDAFAWFERQRHVATALAHGHRLGYVNYRDHLLFQETTMMESIRP